MLFDYGFAILIGRKRTSVFREKDDAKSCYRLPKKSVMLSSPIWSMEDLRSIQTAFLSGPSHRCVPFATVGWYPSWWYEPCIGRASLLRFVGLTSFVIPLPLRCYEEEYHLKILVPSSAIVPSRQPHSMPRLM